MIVRLMCLVLLAAPTAEAQHKVMLQIAPRVGDTLKMRYDQQVDMMGVREAMPSSEAPVRDSTVMRATDLTVLSRAIVESRGALGTDLLAVTDSVAISTTQAGAIQSEDMADQMLEGRQVHFRVSGDGEASITDSAGASPELRSVFAQMPATLPATAIAVGASWKRTMGVPLRSPLRPASRQRSAPPVTLTAVFRLDSLSRDESLAYISLQGNLVRGSANDPPDGVRISMTGDVTGSMIVDRRRGWLVDSHAVIAVSSVVLPASSAGSGATHVQMIVTQWLRTVN